VYFLTNRDFIIIIAERWITMEVRSAVGADKENAQELSIDGLDIKKGIANSGGRKEFYLEILSAFYEDGIQKIDEIEECMASGNINNYSIYVHALKSAAANIGAQRLAEAANALEAAGDSGDINYIQANNESFLVDLKTLLNEISKLKT